VRDAIAHYVALLEAHCRSDPYNWFNFYDFWHGADALPGATPGAGA
jgi:predicted LPLAT superfamily acyltransferase